MCERESKRVSECVKERQFVCVCVLIISHMNWSKRASFYIEPILQQIAKKVGKVFLVRKKIIFELVECICRESIFISFLLQPFNLLFCSKIQEKGKSR